jgi:hypothetical protein
MIVAVGLATAISALAMPWRVTFGLLLGGALSLVNYQWMCTSVGAIVSATHTDRPFAAQASRYILRYFFVAFIVALASGLHLVSLPATLVGLSSFVAAMLVEATREFYFAMVNREGIN